MAPSKELSEKDHALLVNAWKSLKAPPEIDWDKFARLGAYTNPTSGRNAMANIRKKLEAQAEDDGEPPVPGSAKGKATKRKKAGAEGTDEAAPAKPAKRRPKKSAAVVKEEDEVIKQESEDVKEESEDAA